MREVTRYQAEDGTLFNTSGEADKRDEEYSRVLQIMAPLGVRYKDQGSEFANGGGYVQHDVHMCRCVARLIVDECISANSSVRKWKEEGKLDIELLGSGVWIWLDRCGITGPISKATYRMMCIDHLGREWGQPYFCNNPDKAPRKECIWDRTKS